MPELVVAWEARGEVGRLVPPVGPRRWMWMNKAPLKLSYGAQPLERGAEMSLRH